MDKTQIFIKLLKSGKNILLTGGGGVGKTYLLNQIQKYDPKPTAFTASTGVASSHLPHGETIHTFSGIKTYGHLSDLKKIIYNPYFDGTLKRIKKYQRIIIDEISMLSAGQINLLDHVLRYVFGRKFASFGGVQMIFVGDFLQLPPVVDKEAIFRMERDGQKGYWAFQANSWKEADIKTIHLTDVKRQSDVDFINALNDIRFGRCSDKTMQILEQCKNKSFDEEIKPVVVMTINNKVDLWNKYELEKLDTEIQHKKAYVKARNKSLMKIMIDKMITPFDLELKEGCQVMITTNGVYSKYIDDGNYIDIKYQNGSMGTFLGFKMDRVDRENLLNQKQGEMGIFAHVKLHKSGEVIKLSKQEWTYETTLDELKYIDFEMWDNPEDIDFDEKGYDAKFVQYPLRMAYAITIHKSQGMTLEYVRADFKRCFADGQVYVALSRAMSLDGLSIKGLLRKHIKANKDALEFYNNLEV